MKKILFAMSVLAVFTAMSCRQPSDNKVIEPPITIPGGGGDIPVVDNPWNLSPSPIILSKSGMGGHPKSMVVNIDRPFEFRKTDNTNPMTGYPYTIYWMTMPMDEYYLVDGSDIRLNITGEDGTDTIHTLNQPYTSFLVEAADFTNPGETYLFLGVQALIKHDDIANNATREVTQYLSNKVKVIVVP